MKPSLTSAAAPPPYQKVLWVSGRSCRGVALVVTLAILVIVTVLIVGLTMAMRIEREAAHSHLERARAGYFAQMGVEQLVGALHQQIADTNISWISFPGRIVSSGSSFGKLTNSVDLYSGIGNTNLAGVLRPPNLNAQILQDQLPKTYLITDRTRNPSDPNSGAVELPLRWIYVRQDGTLDASESPNLLDKANPIVGRYAYWADDESSKLNYNIAWKRGAPGVPVGNPSQLNLPSLPGMTEPDADSVHASITTNNYTNVTRLFNSPYDARRLGTNLSSIINSNKFEVTHFNHDPNTTFFNEPRIVLTTQEKYAPRDANGNLLTDPAIGAPYFLDILKSANTDPGGPTDGSPTATSPSIIDEDKLTKTLLLLVNYLKRNDWPITSTNSSLQQKYFPIASGGAAADPYRLTQFAIEIIDYVRCKESTNVLVPPLLGVYQSATDFSTDAQAADYGRRPDVYQGLTRTPFITELGLWVPDVIPSSGSFDVKFKIEFYLPPSYGVDSVDLASSPNILSVSFVATDGSYILRPVSGPALSLPISAAECSTGTTVLRAGEYVTVTRTVACQNTSPNYSIPPPPAPRPERLALIVSYGPKNNFLQSVPQRRRHESPVGLWVPIDGPGTAENMISTVETDDPRCNLLGGALNYTGDWKPASPNTLGASNAISTLGAPADASIVPQQDTDSSGRISAASLYMPSPKGYMKSDGTVPNPDGLVKSPGELGYIHTGIQRNLKSIPWRTLRLQPNKYSDTSQVPDWAFMDLFTVPTRITDPNDPGYNTTANNIFYPHGTTIAGRINMNAQAQPFGNPDAFAVPMERIYPLKALFEGVETASGGTISPAQAEAISRNIYSRTLATGANPGKHYGNADAYDSQGEIVEIAGVADGGEESEEVVRGIANLMSARGSVFSLYSIGQALKQTPDGRLVVNGEQRLHTLVERYLDSSDDTVKFRSVYFRNLTP
jgi:hypothetical protein